MGRHVYRQGWGGGRADNGGGVGEGRKGKGEEELEGARIGLHRRSLGGVQICLKPINARTTTP